MRRTVFIARHGERVDYQWHFRGENWQAQAERPWDSPMTAGGMLQAEALGRSIERHRQKLGLPKFHKVYASPLFRCAQTACSAALAIDGIDSIHIEPEIAEGMCESWYRSWGLPNADSTWGGPPGATIGTTVDTSKLHTHATQPASVCHASPSDLQSMLEKENPTLAASVSINVAAVKPSTFEYTWGNFEDNELLAKRMGVVINRLSRVDVNDGEDQLGPILLVSHGGPTAHSCQAMLEVDPPQKVGYCGLFAYVPPAEEGGKWTAGVFGDHEHLKEVPDATVSGRNDGKEQKVVSPNNC
eukprot:m.260856 g.260856  ORF g.260856 m.260856 type:complete len:300 (+) comp40768_c0_seq1:27-926(+)